MESLTADQAKTQFSQLLLKAQSEPVQINENGKPVAVLISTEQHAATDSAIVMSLRATVDRVQSMTESEIDKLQDVDDFFELITHKWVCNGAI